MKVLIDIDGVERDASELTYPQENTFRSAWYFNGDVIEVDMETARNIWREKIRYARIEELSKLDADFMKALETSSDTTEIVAKKQALRDAPTHADIDAASTPDELKAVQPIPNVTVK